MAPGLDGYLEGLLWEAQERLGRIDPDHLLSENEDILVETLLDEYLPKSILINWDSPTMDEIVEKPVEVYDQFDANRTHQVPGSSTTITFPLTGTGDMLKYRARHFVLGPTLGVVAAGEVRMEVAAPKLTDELIKSRIKGLRDSLAQRVAWANEDLAAFRETAEKRLRNKHAARKDRILADRDLTASIGIPIRRTGTQPPPVPARRKQVTLETRRQQAEFVPEPVLDEAVYGEVVQITMSWARSLERTGVATRLGEEDLRDLLLGTLNAYWEGAAGGELFNGAGKTDILIRHDDRNVFIAECKIWDGPQTVTDALNQLLRYLVWRDSKAALIMFIRRAKPAETITRMHTAIGQHPSHLMIRPGGTPSSRVDHILTADNEGRRISLAALPVVLPYT